MLLVLTGCVWDIPEPVEDIDDFPEVSFSEDVIPILTGNCLGAGCHGEGAVPPILTVERAHDELMTMEGMVDLDDPQSSVLYARMNDVQRPMPPSGLLPPRERQLILAWIVQGATDE